MSAVAKSSKPGQELLGSDNVGAIYQRILEVFGAASAEDAYRELRQVKPSVREQVFSRMPSEFKSCRHVPVRGAAGQFLDRFTGNTLRCGRR